MNGPIRKLSILFLFMACATQDHSGSREMRHGIVPLSGTILKKIDARSIARGERLYKDHCLRCHGVRGEGDGPEIPRGQRPVNLRRLSHEVRDFTFFMSISQWQGDMPGWTEHFDPAEREDLVAYIKSFRR